MIQASLPAYLGHITPASLQVASQPIGSISVN